jgi:hypothetical protein
MHDWQSLSHVRWECQLCAAEHNWHYVQQSFMWSEPEISSHSAVDALICCT